VADLGYAGQIVTRTVALNIYTRTRIKAGKSSGGRLSRDHRSNGGVEHTHGMGNGSVVGAAVEKLIQRHHAVVILVHFLRKKIRFYFSTYFTKLIFFMFQFFFL
jgi:hypothetical protein